MNDMISRPPQRAPVRLPRVPWRSVGVYALVALLVVCAVAATLGLVVASGSVPVAIAGAMLAVVCLYAAAYVGLRL